MKHNYQAKRSLPSSWIPSSPAAKAYQTKKTTALSLVSLVSLRAGCAAAAFWMGLPAAGKGDLGAHPAATLRRCSRALTHPLQAL